MANDENLIPAKKGEVRNPTGRPPGIPNRKTILNYLLFESDLEKLGVMEGTKKPAWFDKVKPKTLYELMTLAVSLKASSGDHQAYSALNKALGDRIEVDGKLNIALVEFMEPKKVGTNKNKSKDTG